MDLKEAALWLGLIVVAGIISEVIAESVLRNVVLEHQQAEKAPQFGRDPYGPLFV